MEKRGGKGLKNYGTKSIRETIPKTSSKLMKQFFVSTPYNKMIVMHSLRIGACTDHAIALEWNRSETLTSQKLFTMPQLKCEVLILCTTVCSTLLSCRSKFCALCLWDALLYHQSRRTSKTANSMLSMDNTLLLLQGTC